MEDTPHVINPWVAEILEQGGDVHAAVRRAQGLAREAFTLSDSLNKEIDRDFGGPGFRTQQLEVLLRKERELDALRQRLMGSGKARAADQGCSLRGLLQRRMHEYTRLAAEMAKMALSGERRYRLEAYLEARRRQLYLGDAERVRVAITDFLLTCAKPAPVITALAS